MPDWVLFHPESWIEIGFSVLLSIKLLKLINFLTALLESWLLIGRVVVIESFLELLDFAVFVYWTITLGYESLQLRSGFRVFSFTQNSLHFFFKILHETMHAELEFDVVFLVSLFESSDHVFQISKDNFRRGESCCLILINHCQKITYRLLCAHTCQKYLQLTLNVKPEYQSEHKAVQLS